MSDDYLNALQKRATPLFIPDNVANLIHTDSRSIREGQWFVPIVGSSFDGHAYIEDVLQKGAIGFFYNEDKKSTLNRHTLSRGVSVSDTVSTLQEIARSWRHGLQNLKVVGITGSSGKTTLKELCALMLQSFGQTLKTEGSLNNELGVPMTLCRLTAAHRYAVIEMGARHIGDIAFLSNIVSQDIGVLANVGTAHIGEFGGTENILKAKMEISHAKTCVYFRDDERIHTAMNKLSDKNLISFGEHPESTVRLLEQKLTGSGGATLAIQVSGRVYRQDFSYFHQSFPLNIACAVAVAQGLHLDIEQALKSLNEFSGLKGRFQVHHVGELTLIDDAYNANPSSMLAGLETLRKAYSGKSKTIVLGDMNELGDSSENSHREIGRTCQSYFPTDRLVAVGRQARWIAEAALQSGMRNQQVECYPDVDTFLRTLPEQVKSTQILYVKASNSLKLNKIIDTLLSR